MKAKMLQILRAGTTWGILRIAAWLSCLFILAMAFRVSSDNRRLALELNKLRSDLRAIAAISNTPVLIRGFELPSGHGIMETVNHPMAVTTHFRLILVFDSHCGACSTQRHAWADILKSPDLRDVEVWLVSLDGDGNFAQELVGAIKENELPYKFIRVKNRVAFSILTGIAYTPTTVLTTSEREGNRVLLVVTGLTGADHAGVLLDTIAHKRLGPGAFVLRGGTADAVLP